MAAVRVPGVRSRVRWHGVVVIAGVLALVLAACAPPPVSSVGGEQHLRMDTSGRRTWSVDSVVPAPGYDVRVAEDGTVGSLRGSHEMEGSDGATLRVQFDLTRSGATLVGTVTVTNLDRGKQLTGLVQTPAPELEAVEGGSRFSLEASTGGFYSWKWWPGVISIELTIGDDGTPPTSSTTTTTESTTTTTTTTVVPLEPEYFELEIGDTADGSIAAPGASHVWTFESTGQDVFFDITELYSLGADPGCSIPEIDWTLEGPDGVVWEDERMACFWDQGPLTLPPGSYALTIVGVGGATGTYQFVTSEVEPPDEWTFGIGDTVGGSIESPGVVDVWTFNTTGQDVYFDVTQLYSLGAAPGCSIPNLRWRLEGPGGVVWTNEQMACFWDQGPLTLAAGSYTLTVQGSGDVTGNYQFVARNVPAPDTGTFAVGDTVGGSIESPGVKDVWTFNTTGQDVFFDVTQLYSLGATPGCSIPDIRWALAGPDGVVWTNAQMACFYDRGPLTLPAGSYTLTLQGSGDATGVYQFRALNVPAPDTGTFGIGDTVGGSIESPGVKDVWTFTAAGQSVTFDITQLYSLGAAPGCSIPDLRWRLEGPGGVVWTNAQMACFYDRGPLTLPAGLYTLTIQGSGDETGNYQIATIVH